MRAATRGRPVSRWTLTQHVAHADMAHLKWELEASKCDGCGSLLYRSYFILQTDQRHGYRRFEEELEVCEICADGAPEVPVLPVPPPDLRRLRRSRCARWRPRDGRSGTTSKRTDGWHEHERRHEAAKA